MLVVDPANLSLEDRRYWRKALARALASNGIDPDPDKWKGEAGVFFAKVKEALEG